MSTTLLSMTQDILSDMDGDEVAAIADTIESDQIARVIKRVYDDLVSEMEFKHTKELFQLTASGDNNLPIKMSFPEGYYGIEWVKYDHRLLAGDPTDLTNVAFMQPSDFMEMQAQLDTSDSTVGSLLDPTSGTVYINYKNDAHPSYWTTFDESVIYFNSYLASLDTTLVAAKTMAYGYKTPSLSLTSAAVIDLPVNLMSLLRAEAEELCFEIYKDGTPRKIAQIASRARARATRLQDKFKRDPKDRLPDYGR